MLNFFYGGLTGLVMFIPALASVQQRLTPIPMVLCVYSFAVCFAMFIAGESFIVQNYQDAKHLFQPLDEHISARRYLATLGSNWWLHFLPVQDTATELAWPGVDWATAETVPL
jgi:hypothetical protein